MSKFVKNGHLVRIEPRKEPEYSVGQIIGDAVANGLTVKFVISFNGSLANAVGITVSDGKYCENCTSYTKIANADVVSGHYICEPESTERLYLVVAKRSKRS